MSLSAHTPGLTPGVKQVVAVITAVVLLVTVLTVARSPAPLPPIRIGVLYSKTGTMAISEKPLADGITLAVEEINASGGLNGRTLEAVFADGQSDPATFASEAERLIDQEGVSALFGGWTSASRQAIKPVVERHKHLLFYPVQYEGMEQSPNIVYLGSTPNQQIMPALTWAHETFGPRIYLVGSDYVFPRTAHRIIREVAGLTGSQVVGEHLLPLGAHDVASVIADLRRLRPDVVLNTINGDSNASFFTALADAGLSALPLISFSSTEPEMQAWGGGRLTRHYASSHYFQTLDGGRNRDFMARFQQRFQQRFGAAVMLGAAGETAYTSVKLWAKAVQREGDDNPQRINAMVLFRQTLDGPSGLISLDAATRHAWRVCRIGKVRTDGQIDEISASSAPLRPVPWPLNHSRDEWRALLGRSAEGG